MKNKINNPTRRALNLFFILFLTIGSLMAGTIVLISRFEINNFLSELKTQKRLVLGHQSRVIREKFDSIVSDLLFLSSQNELLTYLKSPDAATKQSIETEYLSMARTKQYYDQIRYLNDDGMEKVRVNFNKGKPTAVPMAKLQNKFNRYYFTDTYVLGKKEIFVSPMDLNIERGKVEQPLKAMIRFGTPVFDKNDRKLGIVLFNYLAVDLLDLITTPLADKRSINMLVNKEGYWLIHPEEKKEWGFMFKDRLDSSFAKVYPSEWQIFLKEENGQIHTKNGLFSFTKIYPLKEGFRSSSGSGDPNSPSLNNVVTSEYFWFLVSQAPAYFLDKSTEKMMKRLFLIGTIFFILISIGAWQLALAISKRRIYKAQLVEQALYDSLTELPNRRFFLDRLEEGISHSIRHGRKLGLLYIDLDGFKNVNDTLGHHAGDELLTKVGQKLKKILRSADTIGRLGGDEFAIILLEIKEIEDAKLVGEKIVEILRTPFQLQAGSVKIGASVGAAIFPNHADSLNDLIKYADTSMYKVKASGKNGFTM